ncbi:MAG: RsmB/NOP family class I SAM-dependent RNA methyltransferase [Candidatus Diapherotrites archaeon]|nr:RsmB/NOP family class I SAM-dependent RNA methyltransferase [Candidatus Diapherotrites archaeon]MDZ4256665.1 RsmB/NOP family class I SAM-dependent RNA methyltransferase [archaeon]
MPLPPRHVSRYKERLPPRLVSRYWELLPRDDFNAFLAISKTKWPRYLRINTLKTNPDWAKRRLTARGATFSPTPFPDALRLDTLPGFLGGWWEVQLGFLHAQELASQIPPRILNPRPGETVLDMAAAPGNKTMQLAEMMGNQGTLLACEPMKTRAHSLRFVLGKGGVLNTRIALQDALTLPLSGRFDKILLDAPCSGEGLLRKNPLALRAWSEKYVYHKARLQTKLMLHAADLLKPGGELVYSVCTLSPEECEGVVTTLLHERPSMEIIPFPDLGLTMRPGLELFRSRTFAKGITHTRRLYPQDNNTQSFFIAKLRKTKDGKGDSA